MYNVYKHTVPNGKVYIGITKNDLHNRWSNGHGYKENKRFFNDIILYGWLNIKHEILYDGLNEQQARTIEAKLIWEYQSFVKSKGYNQQVGFDYGFVERPRYVDKRTTMNREDYFLYCQSDEYKQSCIPKSKCKKVYQYTIDNVFVAEYNSIHEASMMTGINKYCIRDCVNGKQKVSHGYRWVSEVVHTPGDSI